MRETKLTTWLSISDRKWKTNYWMQVYKTDLQNRDRTLWSETARIWPSFFDRATDFCEERGWVNSCPPQTERQHCMQRNANCLALHLRERNSSTREMLQSWTSFSVRVSTLWEDTEDGQLTFSEGQSFVWRNAGCQALSLRQKTSSLWAILMEGKQTSTAFQVCMCAKSLQSCPTADRDSAQSMKTSVEWSAFFRQRMPSEEKCSCFVA